MLKNALTAHSKHSGSLYNKNFQPVNAVKGKTIAVDCKSHVKHINIMRGKNAKFFIVKK